MKSLVLCSGGIDSAVCLALAAQAGEVETLTCNYGQRHYWELASAKALSIHYKVRKHHLVTLPDIFRGSGKSSLVDEGLDLPTMTYQELREEYGVSPTYVPFRNANLLSVAASKALVCQCDYIWFGAHAEDARNWAYPDCTPEFIGAMANAIYIGTYHKVRLMAPLTWLMKADIVQLGTKLNVPFEVTRTCYSSSKEACGICPSCVERLEAFRVNNLMDPVPYGGVK